MFPANCDLYGHVCTNSFFPTPRSSRGPGPPHATSPRISVPRWSCGTFPRHSCSKMRTFWSNMPLSRSSDDCSFVLFWSHIPTICGFWASFGTRPKDSKADLFDRLECWLGFLADIGIVHWRVRLDAWSPASPQCAAWSQFDRGYCQFARLRSLCWTDLLLYHVTGGPKAHNLSVWNCDLQLLVWVPWQS